MSHGLRGAPTRLHGALMVAALSLASMGCGVDAPADATDATPAPTDAGPRDAGDVVDAAPVRDASEPTDGAPGGDLDGGVDAGVPGIDAGPPSPAEVRRVDFPSPSRPDSETFYLVYLPEGYANSGRTYPVMFFYVGSGEIETSEDALRRHGPFRTIRDNEGVAPRGYGMEDMMFVVNNQPVANSNNTDVVLGWEVVERVRATFRVDSSQMFTTGVSMGGNGAHSMVLAHPGVFAAAIPVSAANRRLSVADACGVYAEDTALWIIHGMDDRPGFGITPGNAEYLWGVVRDCPAMNPPRLSLAQGRGHNGRFWNDVYANVGATDWTLEAPGTDALDASPGGSIYLWARQFRR